MLHQPGTSLPVSYWHSCQHLNARPKAAEFQTKTFKHNSVPLNHKIEGDVQKSMQNSFEGESSSLWEESVQKSIIGLKGMQGQARNTKPQKMKGIGEKKNVKRRERGTAMGVGECIFPVSDLRGAGHSPSGI